MTIVQELNKVLPDEFTAEPRVHMGPYFEIDVCAFEPDASYPAAGGDSKNSGNVATEIYAPPKATLDAPVNSTEPEPTFTAEDAGAVHAALDKLSLPHREVLTLFFLKDLSTAEIAEVVGIPPGTVKSRLHHARKSLKAVLSEGASHVQ